MRATKALGRAATASGVGQSMVHDVATQASGAGGCPVLLGAARRCLVLLVAAWCCLVLLGAVCVETGSNGRLRVATVSETRLTGSTGGPGPEARSIGKQAAITDQCAGQQQLFWQRFSRASACVRVAFSARVVRVASVGQACSSRAVAGCSGQGGGKSHSAAGRVRVSQTIDTAAQARVRGECGNRCVHWNAGHRIGWRARATRFESGVAQRRQAQAGSRRGVAAIVIKGHVCGLQP